MKLSYNIYMDGSLRSWQVSDAWETLASDIDIVYLLFIFRTSGTGYVETRVEAS